MSIPENSHECTSSQYSNLCHKTPTKPSNEAQVCPIEAGPAMQSCAKYEKFDGEWGRRGHRGRRQCGGHKGRESRADMLFPSPSTLSSII